MRRINNRHRTVKTIKQILNADMRSLAFFQNSKLLVGSFLLATLILFLINLKMDQLRTNNARNSIVLATESDLQIPADPPTGGKTEGTGTHFEITGSQYLNLAMDTADSVKMSMESIPEIVLMEVEAESPNIFSTSVALNGFLPLTTYHKYEDGYVNHTVFTTDESGRYKYTQDLATPHLVYFQPRPSTKIITASGGGNCSLIGNWNESSKTCTLTQDVTESIQISGDGITLDGNSFHVTGVNTGFGVSVLLPIKNITLKNLNVSNFSQGIYLYKTTGNTVKDNTLSNNTNGIRIDGASGNTLKNNTVSNNINGIVLSPASSNNILDNNTISNSRDIGLDIYNLSDNNIVSGNSISHNYWGAYIRYSVNNVMGGNNLIANGTGITLGYSTTANNKIVNNTVKDSTNNIGIRMHEGTNGNIVYNNYFNNPPFFNDSTPHDNKWNFDKTLGVNIVGGPYIGGNFWALKNGTGFSENCPDSDGDGICNDSYIVTVQGTPMVTDNLPLAKPDTLSPVTSIDLAGTLGDNSWYVSSVTIALSAVDGSNGSAGIAKTEYSFDNASWNTYSLPFAFGDEGAATIYYRSIDNSGNIELTKTYEFKIDKTAPLISGAPTISPNSNNWYNENVTVKFNCSDVISGAVDSSVDMTITTEGANQSAKGTCRDKAGNFSDLAIDGINIDKTAPVASVLKSPDPNSKGWNNTPVTVTFAASDGISGLDGNSTNIVVFGNEGAGQSASYNFSDKAGNISNISASGVNIDLTPPLLSGKILNPPNSNNWYNADAVSHFTASDTLSGLANVSPDITLSSEGANQEAVGTAEDFAGNSASFKISGINIDKTAPLISGAPTISPNSNNWYNENVTVKFSASDDLSGIDSVTPDTVISQEGAGQSASGIATDKAGNAANTEVSGVNLDKTPPSISGAATRSPNSNGWYNSDVGIHYDGMDSLSGIDRITPDIIISSEGAAQTAVGEAFDKAGNSANFTVSGINMDKTSPVTEAALSASVKNTCTSSGTGIVLSSTDNLSGIEGIYYNLDNAGWFSYLNSLLVSDEGQHSLKYNSQDKADNTEVAKEVSFSVDKSSSEAAIKFDSASKDIKVYNSKTGVAINYTVISKNVSDEEDTGWDLRRYKISVCGNNYYTLTLMHKKAGNEAKIKIVSLQYNNTPKIKFKGTSIKASYSLLKDGSINQLVQKIDAGNLFEIEAKYNANKNITDIKLDAEGKNEKKETKDGMVILQLLTDKGSFKYQY